MAQAETTNTNTNTNTNTKPKSAAQRSKKRRFGRQQDGPDRKVCNEYIVFSMNDE